MGQRILIVDDEEPITQLVSDLVRPLGFEPTAFTNARAALDEMFAAPETFALIITDINMPELNGFELRDLVRKHPKCRDKPLIFLTGADASIEREMATELDGEIVQFKPVNVPGLRRIIRSMLGDLTRESGTFDSTDLAAILAKIRKERRNATVGLFRREQRKRLYFRDGQLAFAISNDPKELVGQALIRRGLVSELGLARLFENRGDQATPLGEILVSTTAATSEDINELLGVKIRDAALNVFLWDWGWYEAFYGRIDPSELPFTTQLDLEPIIAEGQKRSAVWQKVLPTLPAVDTAFRVVEIPDTELSKPGDRLLAQLLHSGRSRGQLQLELRGQVYALTVKLSRWLDKGYIMPAGAQAATLEPVQVMNEPIDSELEENTPESAPAPERVQRGTPNTPVAPLLAQALVAYRAGELHDARDGFVSVLQLDPGNPLARKRVQDIDKQLAEQARGRGLIPEAHVMLVGGSAVNRSLLFSETFVLTRLGAGSMTVEALTQICPIPEPELLRILLRMLDDEILEVVS